MRKITGNQRRLLWNYIIADKIEYVSLDLKWKQMFNSNVTKVIIKIWKLSPKSWRFDKFAFIKYVMIWKKICTIQALEKNYPIKFILVMHDCEKISRWLSQKYQDVN